MASKKTLNENNLEALGAKRLAELLIEISAGNVAAKRLLRLELAGEDSPGEVAKEIRKRLTTIARSRSFIDWQNRRALVDDLETQRRAIADRVAKRYPADGLELMWRFLDLAKSVFDRCDDSSGTVSGIFYTACGDLGHIAQAAKVAPSELADHTFHALISNDYGQFDGLIEVLTPALGQEGLEYLKQRMIALSKGAGSKTGGQRSASHRLGIERAHLRGRSGRAFSRQYRAVGVERNRRCSGRCRRLYRSVR